jgi:exodeoxyribonuclease V gamma subunit
VLHVHRAERADGLVEALSELLARPPRDPFAREVVSVPTRGMERWLAQRMSHRLGTSAGQGDGVCANVDFPSPRRLVGDAVAVASGISADEDPWLPERAVWVLLDVLDSCLHEPWLHALGGHLGRAGSDDDPRRNRRFAVVRRLAHLFDRYALHRPEMVRAWAAGRDEDGTGLALRDDQRWQAELFRRLRARIAAPDPAERVEAACRRIAGDPGLLDLPERLSVFGLTRLPAGHLSVMRALAAGRDVDLFLLHPSPALWEKLRNTLGPVVHRRDDHTATIPENRLLASWGHDAREMQLVLKTAEHRDHHHATDLPTKTLLARLQADARNDRQPAGPPLPGEPDERGELAAGDRSVEIHSCHGRARQVEVLRDAILHALEGDPTLEPRDVIVMCPDIETFAPLIQATFGGGQVTRDDADAGADEEQAPDLRVRLADRSIRQTNPVLGVIARLLELAAQRVTASQVLDVVDREPVRRRFGFDDEDVSRLEEWVTSSGIRWGLDADHRAPFKLANVDAGTWRAGLDRVLLGVAMTEEASRLYEGVLPLDDVESGAIELAGRFAELVDRLQAALDDLSRPQTIATWADALAGAADALTATTERDAWQRAELDRILDDVAGEAGEAATELTLPEVRALLAERLQGRPTRANFRTGHLTVCTLMPMRSVPHRVVCLLGMDDGVFPRRSPRDGDDLMLDDPHVGDRDPRTEDRQLLLDALLAAQDRLVVTYAGNDERTNVEKPPAVPIGELLDVVDETVRTDGRAAREQVVIRHPLQPFDPRNFMAGALVGNEPWGFDRTTLHGARAMVDERHEPEPFLREPLPPVNAPAIALDDLVRFAEHPVRAFLRRRLEISLADFTRDVDDALPVELEPLDKSGVGRRLLDGVVAGTPLDACVRAEVARGTLPPGRLAQLVIDDVTPVVEQIAGIARRAFGDATAAGGGRAGPVAGGGRVGPESVDVRVVLPDGRPLAGTVPGLYGSVLGAAAYARVRPTHRIRAWVRLLALSAAYPERDHTAVTVGRARYGADHNAFATVARLPAIAAGEALEHLATIVDLWERGMREPLPIGCDSAAAYADAARREQSATRAGRREWESAWNYPKEDAQLEHQLAFGGVLTFDELLARPPREDESWDVADTSRFGRLARRLWDPLLRREELVDR